MKKIRWGLLSTARINRRVIPGIRASQRGQLAAVASRDQVKGEAYAAEWDIPRVFGSYEEMLASDEVDAVYISLPNHLHAEWTVRALDAGKHVLCEKPFAITLEQVDCMIEASRRAGKVLAEAFMYRHHPQTQLVGEWVRSGRLGEISLARSMFSFFMENRQSNVRLKPEFGGGVLWDAGIYPVSFIQYIYGRLPQAVTGQQWLGDTGVDETFAGQMHYSGGRAAHIGASFRVPYFASLEVHGTQGRITLNRPYNGMNEKDREIIFTPTAGQPEKLQVESVDPYQMEIEDMHAAILDGQPPLISLEESRMHVQTALCLYEAARANQTLSLSSE